MVEKSNSYLPPVITNEIQTISEPAIIPDQPRSDILATNAQVRQYVEPEVTRLPSPNVKKYPNKKVVHNKPPRLYGNAGKIRSNRKKRNCKIL